MPGPTGRKGSVAGEASEGNGNVLVTLILRHDESIPLEERSEALTRKGWWEGFPPEGCEVVAWFFAMGLGHVVVLSLPPSRVPDLSVEVQRSCWGVYGTDFYLSYDFQPVRAEIAAKHRGAHDD
jgi:hypothetical protein